MNSRIDDYLFEDVSDAEFFGCRGTGCQRNEKRDKFAGSLDSVACDNVTALAINFGVGVKNSRNDMLGAWSLMELKTGGLDQKFCNATHGAGETQMCTTECTLDTLEIWTTSRGNDRQLISATQKSQNDKAGSDRSDFAQLGKELEKWVQSQLIESLLSGSASVEPTDEHQGQSAGIDGTGKSGHNSMATVFYSWFHDDQQPKKEVSRGFSIEVEQKVERRIASRFPEIARLLLENRSLSWKDMWSCLEASGQQSWQDYKRNGSYSGRRGGQPFKHQRKKVFMYKCTRV